MIPSGLIVSCQALEGNPLRNSEALAIMAEAADLGGAAAIRANGVADITAIKKRTKLPIIGLDKRTDPNGHVVITPTYDGVVEIVKAGADIIALDASFYDSPIRESRAEIIGKIHDELKIPILADISTFEEAEKAVEMGVDALSTTLSGYIPGALFPEYNRYTPDFALLNKLIEAKFPVKVYCEGRLWRGEDVTRAIRMGADGLIIGKAITNPMAITKFYKMCTDRGYQQAISTESRKEESADIDKLETYEMLNRINRAETDTADIVGAAISKLSELVDITVSAIGKGGRVFYVGAGTSGRISTADAAECPPTYGVSSETFQAVIAGGRGALVSASESCEDNEKVAREAFDNLGVRKGDVVIGISVAGAAPFVLSFMKAASEKGCTVAAIVNNPNTPMEKAANITITLFTGAEVIKGSTRMKGGTAQKILLNMFSTSVCIKLGMVYSNYMVSMKPINSKLKARAICMFTEITGEDLPVAKDYLEKNDWSIRTALKDWELGQDNELK